MDEARPGGECKGGRVHPRSCRQGQGEALTKRVATELLPNSVSRTANLLISRTVESEALDLRPSRSATPRRCLKLRDIQKRPEGHCRQASSTRSEARNVTPPGSDVSERIQALNRKPELTVKEATELYALAAVLAPGIIRTTEMALPSNTLATYEAIGNREDLSNIIYRISPTDTPFMSSIDREKASGVNHEWQTQALAAASTANAQFEGDDATTKA
jgi:hypothetical protein